jgi:hypothetical protein
MTWEAMEKDAAALLRRLGPQALRAITEQAAMAWPREAILHAAPEAEPLLDALSGLDRSAALAYLTGLTAGYAQRADEVSVETVWSGPGSHHVPVRATAAVLADIVGEARHELLLMTYSASRISRSPRHSAPPSAAVSPSAWSSKPSKGRAAPCPAMNPTTHSLASRASSYGTGRHRREPSQARRCTPS